MQKAAQRRYFSLGSNAEKILDDEDADWIVQRIPVHGVREWPTAAAVRSTSAGGVAMSIAWMFGRGVITSPTVVSPNSKSL